MQNSKTTIKVIATILVIIVLAGGYYVFTNYQKLFGPKAVTQSSQTILNLDEIKNDFANRERKSISGVTPPQAITDRFNALIAKSEQAIKDNKPSDPANKDLSWDYLIVANSQMVLGQYDVAEQSYLKTIEKFPNNYRAHMNLGDMYLLMDLPQSTAIKFYDTVNLYPKDALIYTKLADLYFKYSTAPEKAEGIYELGWKNANDKRLVLDFYMIYLESQKRDLVKLEEIKREYEKIAGGQAQQQIKEIEKAIDIQ